MKKSFKIKIGYGADDYVAIEKSELAKAYHCFITEGKMITNDGYALRGKDIIRIEPNWNEIMGYTRDYKLKGEDYQQIGEKRMKFANALMAKSKEIAHESIKTNDISLLATELKAENLIETSGDSKLLADKMRLN